MHYPKADFQDYPRTLSPDDLWGQIRRTVNGEPVGEEQIEMIVQAIVTGLALQPGDCLLDLACGNGALSQRLIDRCARLHGVDYSPYLIEVAKHRFAAPPRVDFELADAASYVRNAPEPLQFDKVLCYGSFSFFTAEDAFAVLDGLRRRFANVVRIFIGNLPDRDRAHLFYPAGGDCAREMSDPTSRIGIWRDAAQIEQLAKDTGWHVRLAQMPDGFYASHYRFDAILDRMA